MYKVFVNDKMILFTNSYNNVRGLDNCLVLNFFSDELVIIIVDFLEKESKTENVVIITNQVEESFSLFKNHFKIIEAAGGIVENQEGKKLFIRRLGKWDLPKGKIEKNEGIEEAAIREVEEECGISNISTNRLLHCTYHVYSVKEEIVLKKTHWFNMSTNYSGPLTPQLEENITDVCWLSNDEIEKTVLNDTYNSIKNLLKETIL